MFDTILNLKSGYFLYFFITLSTAFRQFIESFWSQQQNTYGTKFRAKYRTKCIHTEKYIMVWLVYVGKKIDRCEHDSTQAHP